MKTKTIHKYNNSIRLVYSRKLNKHFFKSNLEGINLTFKISKNQENKINKYNQLPKQIKKENLCLTNNRIIIQNNQKAKIQTNNKIICISKYRNFLNSIHSNKINENILYNFLMNRIIRKINNTLNNY